jgi:hypothetical protein
VPAGAPPGLVGLSLQHAYALIDPVAGVVFTSNAAPVTFLP